MGYGLYSEVYVARSMVNRNLIKIGETTNTARRNRQLGDYNIEYVHSVRGLFSKGYDDNFEFARRSFVESYLRAYLNNPKIKHLITPIGTSKDYFCCKDELTADRVIEELKEVISSAQECLDKITRPDYVDFTDTIPQNLPHEFQIMLKNIFEFVEQYNYYDDCCHMKWKYVDSIFNCLKHYFSKLGYAVDVDWCGSWTYITIKK